MAIKIQAKTPKNNRWPSTHFQDGWILAERNKILPTFSQRKVGISAEISIFKDPEILQMIETLKKFHFVGGGSKDHPGMAAGEPFRFRHGTARTQEGLIQAADIRKNLLLNRLYFLAEKATFFRQVQGGDQHLFVLGPLSSATPATPVPPIRSLISR